MRAPHTGGQGTGTEPSVKAARHDEGTGGPRTSSSHPPESASPAWLRGTLWPPKEPGPSRPKTVPPHGVRASLGPFGGGAKGMFSACPWVAQRRLCPGTGLPGEEQPHLKRPTRIVGRVSGDMASGRSPVPGPRQEARPRGAPCTPL